MSVDIAEGHREPPLSQAQQLIRYRDGSALAAQDDLGVPRARWGAVFAALAVLLSSALATVVISVRVTEVATPLHAAPGTVTAVVRTARAPEAFRDRPVLVRVGDTRLAGRVRTAATVTSPATEQAAAGGVTSTTPAVLIVVAVPAAAGDLATARLEVDFGRHSLLADLVEGRG